MKMGFGQDYEYASYNPIAYDLANHFCEMMANYHSDTPHILDYTLYPGTMTYQRNDYKSIIEKCFFILIMVWELQKKKKGGDSSAIT